MKVVTVAELLLASKSDSLAMALAVLTIEPGVKGVMVIVITAVAPTDKLPSAQVTVDVPSQVPWVVVTGPDVMPDGKVSVTFTLVATAGPLLVTVRRYAKLNPTCPGFGDADLLKARSTLDGLITFSVTVVEC